MFLFCGLSDAKMSGIGYLQSKLKVLLPAQNILSVQLLLLHELI